MTAMRHSIHAVCKEREDLLKTWRCRRHIGVSVDTSNVALAAPWIYKVLRYLRYGNIGGMASVKTMYIFDSEYERWPKS